MQNELRIVFMGTPDFAVASLKYLQEKGHNIVGVITAPDKPAGRGKQIVSSPVKKYALDSGIQPILQPTNLKNPDFLSELKSLDADIQIVVAFRMLPEVVWDMPPKGTINLHASLLPDYRGAAPINWAIINGEKETGVTSFFIEKEIDTGKIIFNDKISIDQEMDAGQLHDLLMIRGAKLLDKTVKAVASGKFPSQAQTDLMKDQKWHAAPKIFKEDCRIDWNKPALNIYNFIRGLSPYPAAYTSISNGEKTLALKIFKTSLEVNSAPTDIIQMETDGKNFVKINTPDGYISIEELQIPGKKRMTIGEFLRGFKGIENYHIAD